MVLGHTQLYVYIVCTCYMGICIKEGVRCGQTISHLVRLPKTCVGDRLYVRVVVKYVFLKCE